MRKNILLLLVALAFTKALFAQDGNHQPYVNYWYPGTLLTWSAATDTSSPFNRGRVPLANRFIDTTSSPCYTQKNPGLKLACLSVGNSTTSFNPSQGYTHDSEYAFGFWQYIDYFVMWGGSAGEGLILAPNPTWIDAGHRNGVKVLGNIFFPPTQYGGQISWVNDLIQQDANGNYPVADKLIEVAGYYGFDGWFMNQETSGGNSATGEGMINFLKYFQQHKPAGMEMMWYDAMKPNGAISYQNALNANNVRLFQDTTMVSNSIFLNYNWSSTGLTNSKTEAINVGRNPFDVYVGIDVSGNGYGSNFAWSSIAPTVATPKLSVGLFEPSWTFHSSPDKSDVPLFYQREMKFWNGANSDPCNPPSTGWQGFAKYYIEKSVINSWPFITRFNTGQGVNGCWIDGNKVSDSQWHNLSDQDILPTWRWSSQSSGTPLTVDLDFTDAYNGGNSLKVSGVLSAANATTVRLYNTSLPVTANANVSLTYKLGAAGASSMKVAVAFTDAPSTFYYLDAGNASGTGWQTTAASLGSYAGKTLSTIGLYFTSASTIDSYHVNIGEIKLTNAAATVPAAPSNVKLTVYSDCQANAEAEFKFDTATSNDIWYYDFYRVLHGDSLQWLGRTPDNAYYVRHIARVDTENTVNLYVVAVNKSGVASALADVAFNWDCTEAVSNTTASPAGSIRLYPNPVAKGDNLTLELPVTDKATCYIYDETGRLVYKQTINKKHSMINVSSLNEGVYLYRVLYDRQTATGKFIIK